MADNRTMAEMLRAPTEGCAEAIVVPLILAEQFELKHSLINMMTSEQFFRLEKDNSHDHIRWWQFVGKKSSRCVNDHRKQIQVNQQTSAVTTAMTAMLKQLQANPPSAPVKAVEEICVTCGGSGSLPSNTIANPKGELKAITTRSGLVTDGPTVSTPPKSVTPEVGERVKETYTDLDLVEYTIKVPPPPKILKALLSNKEKLQELVNTSLNENCSAVILKKLPEKLGDPEKFLIPCGFSELKCKALADLGASINLMPLSVWKELGLPKLIPTRMTLKLANREICTPAGIARDAFIPVSVSNQPSGNPTFSLHQELTSPEVNPDIHDSEGCNVLSEKLPDIDSSNDIYPYFNDNPLRSSTTYFSNSLLEELTDELALITYPPDYDDNLQFDIESDLKEIEFLLYHGKDSNLKDLIDQTDLANLDDYFVDPIPEMFTDEHAPDYSSPLRFDVYDDDFLEVEFDVDNVYDDPFDSKGEKIKESKLLIDELDLPYDFFPYFEYDSFNSQDFFRVDALPSTNNEDKVFNPGILIHEKPVKIITRVVQDKKLARSNGFLVFEDFDPPFYEPLFLKNVPKSKMLLSFSSENEEKFSNQGYTLLRSSSMGEFGPAHRPKQALRGRQPMLIIVQYSRKYEDSRQRIFVLKSSFPLHKLGIKYPNLIELMFILWPTS
nr:reverse transcriptase domain-containing protein [Tanacetum cinerariifolium]